MRVLSLFRRFHFSSVNVGLCLCLILVAGCGGSPEEIRPEGDAAAAKAALQAALDAWKAGTSPAESGSSGAVIWTDGDWQAEKKLSSYQLVEEPVQNGGEWRIFADLTLEGTGNKPTRVVYAVTLGETTVILRGDELN